MSNPTFPVIVADAATLFKSLSIAHVKQSRITRAIEQGIGEEDTPYAFDLTECMDLDFTRPGAID